MTAEDVIRLLDLKPLPVEGGYFKETYKTAESVSLPRYKGARAMGTAIYFLLTPETFSEMHRLQSDEVFHFYLGDPVEMLQLYPDGGGRQIVLGTDIAGGEWPQVVVPGGVWQGSRLIPGGKLALLGCTVSPGFEYEDYESGQREDLVRTWPDWRDLIDALTHS